MVHRLLSRWVLCLPFLSAIGAAHGADIDLVLTVEQLPGGTAQWELAAAARSPADNDGIAGFNIDLVGITSAHHTSPLAALNPNFDPPTAGFIIGGDDFSGNGTLFAAQNQFIAGSRIYGVGEPGFVPLVFGPEFFVRNVPWEHPVTLATGTAPSLFGPNFGQSANMTVWSQGQAALGGIDAEFANVFPSIVRIPFGLNEWIAPIGGSWNTPTNWAAGVVPHLFGAQAGFGDAIASPATVTVDSSVTVDRIEFDHSVPYTIASVGQPLPSITLSGGATIHVAAGSHTIAAPIAGTNGLTKTGPGTLNLSGPKLYTGNTSVAAGTLIVQNQVLPGDNLDVAADTTLRLRQFVNYLLPSGQTLTGRGNVILEHPNSSTELEVSPTSALRGTLNIQADNVINSGRVAPGFSPGIIRIEGDYSQENSGVLEIEVGGLTPGTQHDQLQVTGSASLDGRLEVPLIDGFVPVAGNEIHFVVAQEVNGVFDSIFSPNLASVAPDLALDVDEFQGRIRFVNVAPPGAVQFTAQDPIVSWHAGDTWTQTPGTAHPITISNLIGTPQVVELSDASAFTHQLTVGGGPSNITVAVEDANLSATAGVTIVGQGIIELNDGNLVSSNTIIDPGGQLVGTGTVVGNLTVGSASGAQVATLSPNQPMDGPDEVIGHIDVVGNYQQSPRGTLVLDVEGTDAGQFDTVDVSETVALGGTLRVNIADQAQVQAGDTIRLMTAANFARDTVFESIETTGTEDLFLAVNYPNIDVAGGQAAESFQSLTGTMYQRGDMNHDGAVNADDVPYFALALINRMSYFRARTPTGALISDFGQAGGDFPGANGLRDGRLDFDDIEGFSTRVGMSPAAVAAAISAYSAIVPEPSSAVLAMAAGLVGAMRRRHFNFLHP
jgi:autotransporter-associated beta strand protein